MTALAGIRVVDLSQIVSGPMAACILADQGADVIKVETPGGDPVRGLGPRRGDLSAMFITVNRGKRGLALDLKQPGGCAVLRDMIARADLLIENFRPGVIDRLGFGWEACRALNPRLVFASITGFGPDGPYSNIRVYDPVVQAVSGLAATQVDGEGRPGLIRSLIADKVTALTAAQAITAALFVRERTGEAQRVDIAMLDAAVAFNWPDGMYNHGFADDPPPPFPEYGAMMRLWAAADGQVAVGSLQDAEFVALMRAVGLDDFAADPRLRGVAGRMALQKEWAPRLSAALKAADLDTLMVAFIREGAVGGRVNTLAQVPASITRSSPRSTMARPAMFAARAVPHASGRPRSCRHGQHRTSAGIRSPSCANWVAARRRSRNCSRWAPWSTARRRNSGVRRTD